jgi:hypothetical protein
MTALENRQSADSVPCPGTVGRDHMRSSLAKHQLIEPAGRDQLDRMNVAAWRHQGRFVVCPDEIEAKDPWLAQALRNLANRLYGARPQD